MKRITLVYRGNVSLDVNNLRFLQEYNVQKIDTPLFDSVRRKDITWLDPTLVCTINYMYKTEKGALRQPVLKGFRDDKIL